MLNYTKEGLYNSPDKFRMFINSILEDSGIVIDTTVAFQQQEKVASGRIPDGQITQDSFKIVIETKLYGQQNLPQIDGHLEAFSDEKTKIFLWIDKEEITEQYKNQIQSIIGKYNKKNNTAIEFCSTTFVKICKCFIDTLDEYDFEMKTLGADFELFCSEMQLFNNANTKIRVVLTGKTLLQNLENNIYYNPVDRGYQKTKYLGLYNKKGVKAIGEIICVVDAKYDIRNKKFEHLTIHEGTLTDAQKTTLEKVIIEGKKDFGYAIDDGHKFFFVSKYYNTDFIKTSKGGLMGQRYINLEEIDGYNKKMNTKEIADLLNNQDWDAK